MYFIIMKLVILFSFIRYPENRLSVEGTSLN